MATPLSPSKVVSSTNLSLSNSSPWRLKVTVEAEPDPDSDLFLDLAQEESQTSNNPSKKVRKPRGRAAIANPSSKRAISPPRSHVETILSDDSLGLDNDTTGIFTAADLRGLLEGSPVSRHVTPNQRSSSGARAAAAASSFIIPLKDSVSKQNPIKRKATPARKRAQAGPAASAAQEPLTETPKRKRGRPRKSVGNLSETANTTVSRIISKIVDERINAPAVVRNDGMELDHLDPPSSPAETFASQMPSPPSSPIPRVAQNPRGTSGADIESDANERFDESVVAGEEFSMIAPLFRASTRPMVGLNTPTPTPDAEEIPPPQEAGSAPPDNPKSGGETENNADESHAQSAQSVAIEKMANDVAALSIQPEPKRRRSLRQASNPPQEEETPSAKAAVSSTARGRPRGSARKPPRAVASAAGPIQPTVPEPVDDASSFRRFLRKEPVKLVPGTYEESTVYFDQKKNKQPAPRRKQTPAKKGRRALDTDPVEEEFGNILPDHLLAPVPPPKAPIESESVDSEGTPEVQEVNPFWEEGRSVRWHEAVHGGSFSLNSSSTEKPAPATPKQESTHRLLENEIIVEPFRPNAGKLSDGSYMQVVVPREWTNHYWAVLTEIAYPGTNLALRNKRPMASLHPKEYPEDAMAVRKRILKSFPRDDDGRLTLSEGESSMIDAFEEHMRREIVGKKRVHGETRRLWGFSRDQIKEALVVLKVSRQRRIRWIVSAGERLEDWGLV